MLFENLPLSLPWYPSVALQDRFRPNVAVDPKITQLAPYDGVLPFQVRKSSNAEWPVQWLIKCCGDNPVEDYLAGFDDATVVDMSTFIPDVFIFETLDGMDIITFIDANNAYNLITSTVPDGLPPGLYYMQFVFAEAYALGNKFVSETFRVPQDRFTAATNFGEGTYPCLKWSHNSDIKPLHYPLGFYNLLYLDTFITASEPEVEVTGEKDGADELIPTFQKAVIKYRLSALVPDYLKVAIFVMMLHENREIITERNLRRGFIKNPEVSATLSSDGAYSIVELLFEQISLLINTNCENPMTPPDPYVIGYTPTLVTGYCFDSGDVQVHVTTLGVPPATYGELWKRIGAGPWVLVYAHISRHDLQVGTTVNIGPATSVSQFKVVFRTFTFTVGETTFSTPVATC